MYKCTHHSLYVYNNNSLKRGNEFESEHRGGYMRGFVFGGKKGMGKFCYYIIISKYKNITKKNVHIYRVLHDVLVVMCFLIIFPKK